MRCVFLFLKCIFLDQMLFDHLLESSHRDDSNKWSNIAFGQELMEFASIEVRLKLILRILSGVLNVPQSCVPRREAITNLKYLVPLFEMFVIVIEGTVKRRRCVLLKLAFLSEAVPLTCGRRCLLEMWKQTCICILFMYQVIDALASVMFSTLEFVTLAKCWDLPNESASYLTDVALLVCCR